MSRYPSGVTLVHAEPLSVVLDSDRARVRALVDDWLRRYSTATAAAYRTDLRDWLRWCAGAGVHPFTAGRRDVQAWHSELVEAGRRPTTRARKLAAVASFYGFLVDEDELDRNPTDRVRRPKTGEGHVELTPGLTLDELGRVLAAATGPRDRALVVLLAVTGLRVSEALRLDLDAVEDRSGHRTVLVHGKGGRVDRVPLPPPVVDAFDELGRLERRSDGPVFRSRSGRRLTRGDAFRIVRRLGHEAGLGRPVSPHQLRVTAITGALAHGAPLHRVQDMARHSDPRTTQRYNRARGALDGHAAYTVAAWMADAGKDADSWN